MINPRGVLGEPLDRAHISPLDQAAASPKIAHMQILKNGLCTTYKILSATLRSILGVSFSGFSIGRISTLDQTALPLRLSPGRCQPAHTSYLDADWSTNETPSSSGTVYIWIGTKTPAFDKTKSTLAAKRKAARPRHPPKKSTTARRLRPVSTPYDIGNPLNMACCGHRPWPLAFIIAVSTGRRRRTNF